MMQNRQVNLVNGSLSVKRNSGRVRNITRKRHFFEKDARVIPSEQVLSGTQSPYPVGTQFSAGTFIYSGLYLHQNATSWIQNYDRYRVTEVEVFCTLTSKSETGSIDGNVPVEVFFYEDTDADATTQTSWLRVSDRDNLGRIVLNSLMPSQKVISFRPTASFKADSVTSQSPANVIPRKEHG